ncbi:MAG: methyltransferase domain-containing protein [Polyangiales bacterium]
MSNRTDQSEALLGKESIHAQWESAYFNPDTDVFYELLFDQIVEALGATPGQSVLDAGCGYCFHAMRLARRGLRVTGVDFSEAALRHGRANIEAAGLSDSITIQRADLLALPFEDASFDFVQCFGVLMHIPEVESALEELARVLKPGGRLVLKENNVRSLHVRYWEPTLRLVKKVLGRKLPQRNQTERGIEEWQESDSGGLMVRKTNMDWLARFYEERGLRLVHRFAGTFTELFTSIPTRPLKRAVHTFNRSWVLHRRDFGVAQGNILVFQKN